MPPTASGAVSGCGPGLGPPVFSTAGIVRGARHTSETATRVSPRQTVETVNQTWRAN
jgi:hypothetical protein